MELDHQELYTISSKVASRFFRQYRDIYLHAALDADDLRQEAHLYLWKVLTKYADTLPTKTRKELVALTIHVTAWRLTVLLKRSDRYGDHHVKAHMISTTAPSESQTDEEFYANLFVNHEVMPERSMVWLILKELCTDEEYTLLDLVVNHRLPFDEVAKRMDTTQPDGYHYHEGGAGRCKCENPPTRAKFTRQYIHRRYMELRERIRRQLSIPVEIQKNLSDFS